MNTRTIRFLSGLGAALIFSVSLAGCRLLGTVSYTHLTLPTTERV